MPRLWLPSAPVFLLLALVSSRASGQDRGLEVTYGRWWLDGGPATVVSASYFRPILGPFTYGLGAFQFNDPDTTTHRTSTGGEAALAIGRDGAGPYAVGTVGVGMRHRGGDLDAQWSAGVGYALQPLPFLSISLEGRYRVEDQAIRGFWQLDPSDRRGWGAVGRVAIGFGGATGNTLAPNGRPHPSADPSPHFATPSDEAVRSAATTHGATSDAAAVTTRVVRAALDAMGTPYSWGGTDANGFDCSGLIQFAYASQGVILPRVSGDQMRTGVAVARSVEVLRPGDILGFSVEGDHVTHVGLYVGDGSFIHSASGGVKLSSLTAADPDSQWWQRHWLSARRVVP